MLFLKVIDVVLEIGVAHAPRQSFCSRGKCVRLQRIRIRLVPSGEVPKKVSHQLRDRHPAGRRLRFRRSDEIVRDMEGEFCHGV